MGRSTAASQPERSALRAEATDTEDTGRDRQAAGAAEPQWPSATAGRASAVLRSEEVRAAVGHCGAEQGKCGCWFRSPFAPSSASYSQPARVTRSSVTSDRLSPAYVYRLRTGTGGDGL